MFDKKEYWALAFNRENSLGSHCTGLVENINKLHKQHVGLKCGLSEYLYRTIKFSAEFSNKDDISSEELLQFNTYYSLMKCTPDMIAIQDELSSFAVKRLFITVLKSMSWKRIYARIVRMDNTNFGFTITRTRENLLDCECQIQWELKLPCEHILTVLSEARREEDILDYIGERWSAKIHIVEEDLVLKRLMEYSEVEKPTNFNDNESNLGSPNEKL